MHLDVIISLFRSAYLHTFPGIGSRFFLLHRFFEHSCERNDREDTHVHYVVSLFVFVVVFVEEQGHDSRIQFLRVWDEETLADLMFALRQTLNVYERTVIDMMRFRSREIQRVSRWYALHKAVPVRFALLWRSSSFSSTTCIETTYKKKIIIFSIISLKVVSQRSVFVTFDLIVVTKILEHKWQSDRRRRSEVRQDSETQQRNSVKVICAKCRLLSLKSRVQKNDVVTLRPTYQIILIELFGKFDEAIRERTFHQ